mmetsp:Transcript_15742/g.23046  ORF Transcript_15742/g.23046 Transcript_15742/m.23046 type:complete len:88 (+) Transcript_15742:81-344(+)
MDRNGHPACSNAFPSPLRHLATDLLEPARHSPADGRTDGGSVGSVRHCMNSCLCSGWGESSLLLPALIPSIPAMSRHFPLSDKEMQA